MSYKNILTVIHNESVDAETLKAAAKLARDNAAHLDVLCLGIDQTQTGYYYVGANAVIVQETLERAQKDAENTEIFVKNILQNADIGWSSETAVAQIAGIIPLVADRARFADLIVLPRPYGEGRKVEDEAITEAALFQGDVAVLMVPETGLPDHLGQRIIAAWNESTEAMGAVRKAMPMLATAEAVDITIIDPPTHGPDRSDPGGRLSQMIARHGGRAEISVLSKTMPRVADVLRRHAQDRGADMIVMGAYGHSRFREALMGGATRHMLETCEVPLFLAH